MYQKLFAAPVEGDVLRVVALAVVGYTFRGVKKCSAGWSEIANSPNERNHITD